MECCFCSKRIDIFKGNGLERLDLKNCSCNSEPNGVIIIRDLYFILEKFAREDVFKHNINLNEIIEVLRNLYMLYLNPLLPAHNLDDQQCLVLSLFEVKAAITIINRCYMEGDKPSSFIIKYLFDILKTRLINGIIAFHAHLNMNLAEFYYEYFGKLVTDLEERTHFTIILEEIFSNIFYFEWFDKILEFLNAICLIKPHIFKQCWKNLLLVALKQSRNDLFDICAHLYERNKNIKIFSNLLPEEDIRDHHDLFLQFFKKNAFNEGSEAYIFILEHKLHEKFCVTVKYPSDNMFSEN